MNTELSQIQNELIELLPKLRRFAYSLTCDLTNADDLTQASIERAMSRISTWDSSRPLKFWIFKIAKNLWLDQLRAQSLRGITEDINDELVVVKDNEQADMETSQELDEVTKKIQELPRDQHITLVLVAVEGYSYKEAAEMLDVPIGTVMSRVSRARKTLIDHFDKY